MEFGPWIRVVRERKTEQAKQAATDPGDLAGAVEAPMLGEQVVRYLADEPDSRPAPRVGAYKRVVGSSSQVEARPPAVRSFSLRQVAARIGVEPSYLSRVERGKEPPPSEEKIKALAVELDLDADVLLAMAGKVSSELKQVIMDRPEMFGQLLRELRDLPDHAVLRLVREVRDGDW